MSYSTSRTEALDPHAPEQSPDIIHGEHGDVIDIDPAELKGQVAWTRQGAAANWVAILAMFVCMAFGLHFVVDSLATLFPAVQAFINTSEMSSFKALAAGMLATTLLQSSSAVTVGLVYSTATGLISPQESIPAVFGANIATTFTPMILALWISGRHKRHHSRRAYQVVFTHVWFNILGVASLLPIELLFHPLSKIASRLVEPVNAFVASEQILQTLSVHYWGQQLTMNSGLMWVELIGGCVLTVVAMKALQERFHALVRGTGFPILARSGGLSDVAGLTLGVGATMATGFSSATVTATAAARATGSLYRPAVMPIVMGANIGTTLTGILVALGIDDQTGALALHVALVHLLFNLTGTLLVLLLPFLRHFIAWLADHCAASFSRHPIMGIALMLLIAWVLPYLIIRFA